MYVLPKAGLAQQFPGAVLYGSIRYQGRNLNHPYFMNYIQQLHTLLHQQHSNTLTGELQRIEFETYALK